MFRSVWVISQWSTADQGGRKAHWESWEDKKLQNKSRLVSLCQPARPGNIL